ncbi:hypothetical protein H6P81_006459 [Aristolochia fimbriata]|uniref:Uncharacterized protein n=1 Tax=Aristolochia fimbriata TaxID=158543 RepID=A0AAV7EXC9_ARIFI|nr:hypothetical protein H6P81_006459 [Aristolochia fimbriata]
MIGLSNEWKHGEAKLHLSSTWLPVRFQQKQIPAPALPMRCNTFQPSFSSITKYKNLTSKKQKDYNSAISQTLAAIMSQQLSVSDS